MTRPTLATLARHAAVSPATASRVMNNSGPVSPATRAAVLDAARAIGYRHKGAGGKAPRIAAGAGSARSPSVEVVWHWHSPVDQIEVDGGVLRVGPSEPVTDAALITSGRAGHSFYRDMVGGILGELHDNGLKAVLQTNHDLTAQSFLDDLNAPGKLGVLLIGEYSLDTPAFVDACRQPLVLVDQLHRGWPDVVTIDNVGGIGAALRHLIALGHRDIGFLGGLPQVPMFRERRQAWTWRMLEAGLAVRPEWIRETPGDIRHTQEAATDILRRRRRPSAIVCVNDSSALGVYRAAAERGLSIPEDLSVVGFDDIDAASLITPALTTVHVPVGQLGRRAVRELLAIPRDGRHRERDGAEIRVRTRLVVRDSTARPGPAAHPRPSIAAHQPEEPAMSADHMPLACVCSPVPAPAPALPASRCQ